jgi:hypothetical protein
MAQPWAKISGGAAPTSIEPTLLEGSIDVDRDNIPIWPAALPKFNRCPYRKSHPFDVLNLTHRDGHENPAPHVRFCPKADKRADFWDVRDVPQADSSSAARRLTARPVK